MDKPIYVQIADPNHPHFREYGELTGEVIKVINTDMAKVKLDNCKHGTDGCFVAKGQVREVRKDGR